MSVSRQMTWDELAQENARLKRQLATVLEAIGKEEITPCPSNVGLTDSPEDQCYAGQCKACWKRELEAVE